MEENLPLSTAFPENTLAGGSAEGVVEGAGGSVEGADEDNQDESTYVCACSCACAGAGACDARYDVCGRSWSCRCNCGNVSRVLRMALNRLLREFWEGSRGSNPHFNISDLAQIMQVAPTIQTSIDNMCNESQARNRPEAIVSDMFETIVSDIFETNVVDSQNVIDFLCGWLTLKVEDDEYSEYPWRTLIAPIFYLLVLQRLTDADSSVDRSALLGIIIKHARPIVAQIKSKALDYVIYEPIRVHFMEIFEEKCYS